MTSTAATVGWNSQLTIKVTDSPMEGVTAYTPDGEMWFESYSTMHEFLTAAYPAATIDVKRVATEPNHDCDEHAVPYNDGRYHGWECGKCGRFLQAG
jgi:hypothetical protein